MITEMKGRPGQTRPLANEKEKEDNIWSVEENKNREGKGGNIWRGKIFGRQRRRKTEKGKEENIWRRKISGSLRRRRTEKGNEENVWRRKISGFL